MGSTAVVGFSEGLVVVGSWYDRWRFEEIELLGAEAMDLAAVVSLEAEDEFVEELQDLDS
jgi:hypothetical protein